MPRTLIVIPARYASTRLPGKPLLSETGKPLIQHTVEAAARVPDAEVIVATDDQRILEAVKGFGGNAVMTSSDHQSGSDRVAEAAKDFDGNIVVNVQGDEPEIDPDHIQALIDTHAAAMQHETPAFVSTLVYSFPPGKSADNPNVVKSVLSQPMPAGFHWALYFSRAQIPYPRNDGAQHYGHVGLYAYSTATLQQFPTMAQTPLELSESLEQLRVLEHGYRIAANIIPAATPGIDTPADYEAFVARYRAAQGVPDKG